MPYTKTEVKTRGRITIPKDLREKFNIKEGSKIAWLSDDRVIFMVPPSTASKKKSIKVKSKNITQISYQLWLLFQGKMKVGFYRRER